jgi:hypothetical protein
VTLGWIDRPGKRDMKRIRLATEIGLLAILSVPPVPIAAAPPQPATRPYNPAAVRPAAAQIQKEIVKPTHQEEALAGPLQLIAESLASLTDLKDVPDEVLDAVAALAGTGRMAADTLMRFGDRAVAPLVRSARSRSTESDFRSGAMTVLQEMLQRTDIRRALSPASNVAVRTMVRDLLANRQLGVPELASLGSLAVATSDPDLRAAAIQLMDPAELDARGVKPEWRSFVLSKIRLALESVPAP